MPFVAQMGGVVALDFPVQARFGVMNAVPLAATRRAAGIRPIARLYR